MDFFKDNWAGLIGIVGAWFSVFAYLQARTAAREARDIKAKLIKKTLAEDLASLSHSADRALGLLTGQDAKLAYPVLGPALSDMRLLAARRRSELDGAQVRALSRGIDLLDKTLDLFSGDGMTPGNLDVCTKNVRKVQEVLIYCQGTVMAVVDQL
jgi:hypothetical protein